MGKRIYLGLILLPLVLLFAGCATSLYQLDKEVLSAPQVVIEERDDSEAEVENKSERKEYTREELNKMSNEKKNLWREADKNLSALTVSEDTRGVKRYIDKNSLCKVVIEKDAYGTENLEYVREYYFHNDVLYFVKFAKGSEEMRFYFHEGQLIRWIDAARNSYDHLEQHEDFDDYEESLLSEAYDLQGDYEADKVVLDAYVD